MANKKFTLVVLLFLAGCGNASSLPAAAASDRWLPRSDECIDLNPYWTPCTGRLPDTSIPFSTISGYVLAGRPDVWEGAPDFFINTENRYWGFQGPYGHEGTPKIYMRSAVLADKGDTPDLAIRRAGPDQSGPYGTPEIMGDGQGIGTIYWQAWGGNCAGGESWYAGCGGFGRIAAIWARTVGTQTATSRSGALYFSTTPPENPGNTIIRFRVSEHGQFVAHNGGSHARPAIALHGAENTGLLMAPTGIGFSVNGHATFTANLPSEQSTSITLLVKTNGTTIEKKVEVGDANSCGTGYRCLRVPN